MRCRQTRGGFRSLLLAVRVEVTGSALEAAEVGTTASRDSRLAGSHRQAAQTLGLSTRLSQTRTVRQPDSIRPR